MQNFINAGKAILVFSSLFISLPILTPAYSAPLKTSSNRTPYLDQIQKDIDLKSIKSFEDLLDRLPGKMLERFSLVYESRSLQSASLQKPRVILRSEDNQFMLAFSSPESIARSGDQSIEMIENYGPNETTFATIQFSESTPESFQDATIRSQFRKQITLERNPKVCTFCHGSENSAHGIIEGYPHWTGFFGSSHNGRAYGEGSGSARLPLWDFEKNALEEFIRKEANTPLYRKLKNINSLTLQSLSSQNGILGTALTYNLHHKQNNQILENIHSLHELSEAVKLSTPLPNLYSSANDGWGTNELYPEILTEAEYKDYLSFITREMPIYRSEVKRINDEKFNHLKGIVLEYGSERDQKIINEAKPFSAVEKFQPTYLPYPAIRSDLGINVANVMNYFDEMEQFSYAGLFYRYFTEKNKLTKRIKMNNLLEHSMVRTMTGSTLGNLLTSSFAGFEDTLPGTNSFSNARNYRDFNELIEWIPSPFKVYSWSELKEYPLLEKRTLNYFNALHELIENSPEVKKPENKDALLKIFNLPSMPDELRRKFGLLFSH